VSEAETSEQKIMARKTSALVERVSPYSALPFFASQRPTKQRPMPRNFWKVTPTGNYERDCKTGYEFALLFLAAEEQATGGTLLPSVVADMPRGSDLTGVEIGFLMLVGFAATDGAERARVIANHWRQQGV